MKEPYNRPLSLEEMREIKDADIDFSDIPEADNQFWKEAKVVMPGRPIFD